MKKIIAAGGLALALAGIGGTASAGDIVGGSDLLDAGKHAQLERWLGAGEFNLNNVYTLHAGDTSADFHAAADGQGATFTLLEVTNSGGDSFLVGGYNPQSWSSSGGWNETERDWQRTAFLFNFTEPAVYRQILSTYVLPSQGQYQTFNATGVGPMFGVGPDLVVTADLDTALSWQTSYGNPLDEGKSIVDRSTNGMALHIDGMEVFAISPVPEPGETAMLIAGMGVLALMGRKRARRRTGAA
ncbi:PEP_CTERM-anchored TLD domain-containing protein [Massilia sp. YIM B02763]|uniref:PEP_CTERM-anchored TLD domain-containing protein n=1 Tax=Massilia sp. YIM B02763 TaxID=3050130 RepID=UPI0025B6F9A6|nr:PEP_CTERM-anchored TLD domain-containing protein [Massilia sp. YIM B02763]MDN4052429.1 PEP_CTERM-anchored TLD domain-containing protein [Massilia sp. YIM B02763]